MGGFMTKSKVTFFIDDLDGFGSIGIDRGETGTQTLNHWKGGDEWFYPNDLHGEPFVLNVFDDENGKPLINVYTLPENWQTLVKTESIHDIIEEQSQ